MHIDFICPGAQKSATTTLQNILLQHPDIYLPEIKETLFFSCDELYAKGLDWYENEFFSSIGSKKLVGEISTGYMYADKCPERIHKDLGCDIKFIFLLRNPIDRTYSQYWMMKRLYGTGTFEEELMLEEERNKRSDSASQFRYVWDYRYADNSMYTKHIKKFLCFFQKSNMKFVLFEDLTKNTLETSRDIFNFLDLPSLDIIEFKESNKGYIDSLPFINKFIGGESMLKKAALRLTTRASRDVAKDFFIKINRMINPIPQMSSSTRNRLGNIFKDDIKELESIIEKDLSKWYEG